MEIEGIELSSLRRKLEQLSPQTSHSIHKIPSSLCNVNKKAYEPEMVAIGPYHRGTNGLEKMEELKLRCISSLLLRKSEVPLEHYFSAIAEMEKSARDCYAEPISLNKSDLIEMLVLDGSFIIELTRPGREILYQHTIGSVPRDLILLENQIPFSILCKLFEIIEGPDLHVLMERILSFCRGISPGKILYLGMPMKKSEEVKHILDLVHSSWSQSYISHHNNNATKALQSISARVIDVCASKILQLREACKDCTRTQTSNIMHHHYYVERGLNPSLNIIPSVAQLKDANVKFKNREYDRFPQANGGTTIFDVMFNGGVMLMPTLIIVDDTESVLRNLIAFEQYRLISEPARFTNYALLLDRLINSSRDAQILSQHGIIENHLGSDQAVVDFVNRLTDKVCYDQCSFEYANLFHRINEHHKKPWNRAVAVLRHDYFSSPWAYLSILGVFLLLLLTMAQTYFAARG